MYNILAPSSQVSEHIQSKSKPTWCFHANKLLTQINLGHLNPNNVTSLSPKEFQTIVITKLTNKANYKWRMGIWDHNTYCTDSGGRLHNYRVIKQQPRPECYTSGILCRGHRWIMAALRGGCLPLHIVGISNPSNSAHTFAVQGTGSRTKANNSFMNSIKSAK